jgi:hypothetical protein
MRKSKQKIINFFGLLLNQMYLASTGYSARAYPTFENNKLIDNIVAQNIIKNKNVEDAMKSIDRGDFVMYNPYQDSPQGLGYSATISAPHMHAYALVIKNGMSDFD